MPEISAGAPMTTAVTDLITAVVILPLMLSLHALPCKDKTRQRLWLALFLSIGIGSFLGFIAHIFVWSTHIYSIIWVFLYAVLFQVLHVFLRLSLHAALGAQWLSKWRKGLISISVILLYLLTAALELAGINPIRLFVVYCIIMAVPGLYLFAKTAIQKKVPGARTIWFSFLPQHEVNCDRFAKYILNTAMQTKFKEVTIEYVLDVLKKHFDI